MHPDAVQILVNYHTHPSNFRTAWNTLAAVARGRYLCILGDDDTVNVGYFRHAIDALDRTGADIAYCDVQCAHRDANNVVTLREIYRPPARITLEEMRHGNKLWQSSIVRASTFAMVGGYDMSIEYCHDYDFWVRCLKDDGNAVYVPCVGWTHFSHDAQRVTTTADHAQSFARFDRKHPNFRSTTAE